MWGLMESCGHRRKPFGGRGSAWPGNAEEEEREVVTDIDVCVSAPCENGGICIETVNGKKKKTEKSLQTLTCVSVPLVKTAVSV